MSNKPIILERIRGYCDKTVSLCNRTSEIEYGGFNFIIKIEPIVKEKNWFFPDVTKYVWLVYFNHYDKELNKHILKMVACSRKEYEYNPDFMMKDAFECIQQMVNYMDE